MMNFWVAWKWPWLCLIVWLIGMSMALNPTLSKRWNEAGSDIALIASIAMMLISVRTGA